MAGLRCSVNYEYTSNIAADAWKTVAAVKAPTNMPVQVLKATFFPDGLAGDAPHIKLRLVRITAASGTGTATTPIKLNNGLSTTVQSTARVLFSAEPTEDGTLPYLYPSRSHPQGALMHEVIFDGVWIKEGTELALQAFVVTTTTIKPLGHLIIEE